MHPHNHHFSAFRAFISKKVALTEQEWFITTQGLELLRCKANTVLLKEGQICGHLYFLNQGLMRFFVVGADGKDTTKFFTLEHQLFSSQQSFSTQAPATENIEALENSEIIALSHAHLQILYDEIPKWHTFIRRVLQEVNMMTERIYMESITTTAEERYRKLLRDEPNIAQRAALKHIASYLGVTPESLSRIRKKLAVHE